jgi:acetylornithine deacetylase
MKGGIAAMTLAAEVLAALNIRLGGDLVVSTNTDEESSGAGGMALAAHGVGADAGIVPEPTSFNAWIACRGSNYLTIDVPGRPGHAEIAQPDWRDGGAVNAIDKASIILAEIGRIRHDWQQRPELRHRLLPTSDIVPTMAAAGEWGSTYPSSYRILCVVPYVPAHADLNGWSRRIQNEVSKRIATAAAQDEWLAANPPIVSWSASTGPMEIAPDEEIIATVLDAGAAVGRAGTIQGLSSWFDGATFTRAGTPTIAFGPSGRDNGRVVPHAVNEFVPVDDLVTCAQALALTAMRFCGVQSSRSPR